VHRAARICAVGHGGQILLSNATAGIVEDLGRLEGIQLLDLGEHKLKDMDRPQRLFQLEVEGLVSKFPALATLESGRSRPSVVTLLLADVTGWQHVLRTLGDEGATVVARAYHDLAIATIRAGGGRELEVVADTVLASFEQPRDALRASVALRAALRTEPWFPDDDPPEVRMAIHSGRLADPTAKHLGSVGLRCVSLCNTAEPSQILVSHATEALLEGEPLDVRLRDLGERTLPNLEHPVHVFEVDA
jgi:class 3 adenylate cyclase